ncbi:MAG: putative ABC transporter permease subunit [Candidatus Zixiibacteriota bacterium]
MKRIISTKLKLLGRQIFQKGLESKAKLFIGLIVISIFSGGGYILFHQVFKYLKEVQDIGAILSDRLIGIGFMAFGFMLLISNIVSAISTLYHSDETHFLMTSPLSHRKTFWIKFADNLFFSSWATAVIGIPLFLAYSIVFELKWFYFLPSVLIALPAFIIIPAFFGVIMAMVFFIIAGKLGFRKTLYISLLVVAGGLFLYMRQNQLSAIMMSIQGDLNVLNYYLNNLSSNNPTIMMPWDMLASILKFARYGNLTSFLMYLSLIISTAAFGAIFLDWTADLLYYNSFLAAGEVSGKKKKKKYKKPSKLHGLLWKFFSPFPNVIRALLVKDVKLFIRDPSQWTQFGVLLVLLGVYLVNLRHAPMRVGSEALKLGISFANYGFCGYILATLSVRFVYPSISMEGRSFWLVRSSPTKVSHIFWEKFSLAFGIFFIIAEIVAVISNGILAQSPYMMILTGGGIFFMSVSLVSLSVGLGILFPDFEEANPGKIASSGGGMITALLSLLYVGLSVLIMAWPTRAYIQHLTFQQAFPTFQIIMGGVLLILLNVVATGLPLYLGVKEIKKFEF